ncbi:MAG: DUF2304 domain-containing protein [Bacilli bacterium]|nr:DUF2304 domain-containing protein [Bacilli bacterium]
MNINLIIVSGIFSIFIIIFILHLVHKEKINVKYSLVWLILFIGLLVCLFIPGLLSYITKALGFQTASNMILSLLIAVLVIINITNTVINSSQDRKIRLLIQEISIIKKDREKNE